MSAKWPWVFSPSLVVQRVLDFVILIILLFFSLSHKVGSMNLVALCGISICAGQHNGVQGVLVNCLHVICKVYHCICISYLLGGSLDVLVNLAFLYTRGYIFIERFDGFFITMYLYLFYSMLCDDDGACICNMQFACKSFESL